jgi:hypothetical protein
MHPAALQAFKQDVLAAIDPGRVETDSCVDRARLRFARFMFDSIYHVADISALARLPADTVFARARQRAGPPDTTWAPSARTILGSLIGNDSTAYVLVNERRRRERFDPPEPDRARVYTLRRYGQRWAAMDTEFLEPPTIQGLTVLTDHKCLGSSF